MENKNETSEKEVITVETTVNAPVEKVWEYFTMPVHIIHWNNASDDWYTPRATNDVEEGGSFVYRMEAKDGSFGFDFGGTYDEVRLNKYIKYTLGDGRKVSVTFTRQEDQTSIIETFEPEAANSVEMQQKGWQSILDSFKKYTEAN